jgi:hypothetical protein
MTTLPDPVTFPPNRALIPPIVLAACVSTPTAVSAINTGPDRIPRLNAQKISALAMA